MPDSVRGWPSVASRSAAPAPSPNGHPRARTRDRRNRGSLRHLLMAAMAVAVLGSSQALVVAPASAEETQAEPSKPVPALRSEPAPETRAVVAAGDFRNPPSPDGPPVDAPSRDDFDPAKATPVDEETTPTRKVYENPDGSHTALVTEAPARFRGEDGGWVDFDLTLIPAADDSLAAKAAPGAATLGAKADGALATVQTEAGPIVLHHPDLAAPLGRGLCRQGPGHFTPRRWARRAGTWCWCPPPTASRRRLCSPSNGRRAARATASSSRCPPASRPAMRVRASSSSAREGKVVATYGGGIAFDANVASAGPQSTTPVLLQLVEPEDGAGDAPSPTTSTLPAVFCGDEQSAPRPPPRCHYATEEGSTPTTTEVAPIKPDAADAARRRIIEGDPVATIDEFGDSGSVRRRRVARREGSRLPRDHRPDD